MEPPGGIPPDRDKFPVVHQQPNATTSTPQHVAQQPPHHHQQHHHQPQQQHQQLQQHPASHQQLHHHYQHQPQQQNSSLIGVSTAAGQQALERLSRPMAFDKMEALVREMQDPENGVPVRQQKMFLTSIPYAFMGYDLIEWLMDRLSIEESEALSIANQLCLHGYFFPVNDTKTLTVKDDSSLYRFQTPYYWPWQHKAPDNVEYAIYLAKRSLRNKQRHGLEDYESDALASLHKNLKGKWDFISMQAEEQVRLAKERKKGDKIVGDSQERAYWRVHRPPPNQFTPLEPCPVPSRDRQGIKPKKRTVEDWQREVDYLKKSLARTRMKMSQACESLCNYWETFSEYDFFLHPALPSNPWVSEDTTFWQLNSAIVDLPTEKRIKRWAISIEELVSDPTGIQEFTTFLEKEYSHENIRFWIAVNRLRRSAHSQVAKKVNEIYEEFLKPGAPCEINIDGKTMEIVQRGLKNPSRFTFDAAAEHIYMLLLKKDCYPRFIRSDHYKSLLERGIQPAHKKRFFGFGGVAKKKSSTAAPPNPALLAQTPGIASVPQPGTLSRRRGSDRSLTGSAHELAITSVKEVSSKVPHSHSQNNLNETQYSVTVYRGDMPTEGLTMDVDMREPSTSGRDDALAQKYIQTINREPPPVGMKAARTERLESTSDAGACAVCPWDVPQSSVESAVMLSVCPWDETQPTKQPVEPKNANDITEVSERMRRSCGLRQNTVDSDYSSKRLTPHVTEQRRASMTMAPRISEFQFARQSLTSTTPSPTAFPLPGERSPLQHQPASKKSSIEMQEESNSMVISEEPVVLPVSSETCDESISGAPPTIVEVEDVEKCASSEDIKFKELTSRNEGTTDENTMNTSNIDKSADGDKTTSLSPAVVMQSEFTSTSTQGQPPIINVCPVGESEDDPTDLEADEAAFAKESPANEPGAEHRIQKQSRLSLGLGDSQDDNVPQEELSPTTEEYQEARFGENIDEYSYTIEDVEANLTPGCVAPAPTPAPSLAPLAEIEPDQVDEEPESMEPIKSEAEEPKKRRKKRDSNAKKLDVTKEEDGGGGGMATQSKEGETDRNTVCPWEDENLTTASDGTFVKTYATLGYL
ncbi:regulator of G-protein signaling 9 isoform X9 [Hermetia illucens]|uniref:regulator of G-protein signaling 9 isoform X9 n=1 Tax=Hermetia illucens TaxID=343691 RepID=UPI0018CC73C3|nr:regulator of G-protein signaling 9 isoform X9 [Hermetia illucens]